MVDYEKMTADKIEGLEQQLIKVTSDNSSLQLEIHRLDAQLKRAEAFISGVQDTFRGNVKSRGDVDE